MKLDIECERDLTIEMYSLSDTKESLGPGSASFVSRAFTVICLLPHSA